MTAPAGAATGCQIVAGEKLIGAVGGSPALCQAIERAVAARGLARPRAVAVRVAPRSMFTATVTLADGRTLPALEMAEMDRPLDRDTLARFGAAVADHIARSR